MELSPSSIADLGKGFAIVLQALFGVYGLTHEFKKEGVLTKAGKIAVAGICFSSALALSMYALDWKLRRDASAVQATISERAARAQVELLRQQAASLEIVRRTQLPFVKARFDVGIALPANSEMNELLCGDMVATFTDASDKGMILDSAIKHPEALDAISDAYFSLIIAEHPAVGAGLPLTSRPQDISGVDYIAVGSYPNVGRERESNSLQYVNCYKSGQAILVFKFDSLKVEKNSIVSLRDLEGKVVGIEVYGARLPEGTQVAWAVVHYAPDPGNESMDMRIGFWDDSDKPIPVDSTISRESSVSGDTLTAWAIGTVDGKSMPNLPR